MLCDSKNEGEVMGNLVDQIKKLDGVAISITDLEQLALCLVLDSPESKEKVNALRLLIDIKKHLSQNDNEKMLMEALSNASDE